MPDAPGGVRAIPVPRGRRRDILPVKEFALSRDGMAVAAGSGTGLGICWTGQIPGTPARSRRRREFLRLRCRLRGVGASGTGELVARPG